MCCLLNVNGDIGDRTNRLKLIYYIFEIDIFENVGMVEFC